MGPRPVAPFRNRVLHRPQKVIDAGVSDELEALLQVGRERLVVGKRLEMFLEAARTFEREQLARVVDHRGDFRPAAYDPLVLDQGVDVTIRHARDALDVEAAERLCDRRPLRIDDAPAYPRLEYAFAQMLEVVIECLRGVLRWRPFHCSILPSRRDSRLDAGVSEIRSSTTLDGGATPRFGGALTKGSCQVRGQRVARLRVAPQAGRLWRACGLRHSRPATGRRSFVDSAAGNRAL